VESGATETQAGAAAIAGRLSDVLGEPIIGELQRLSSGASREILAFRTASRGSPIAQIARGGRNS